jgi:hypothetical protein
MVGVAEIYVGYRSVAAAALARKHIPVQFGPSRPSIDTVISRACFGHFRSKYRPAYMPAYVQPYRP